MNNDKKVLKKWIALEKAKMVYENDIEYAKEQGRKEGIKEGRKEGRETSKLEIIRSMLNKRYNYQSISELTGKTIEEIKEISLKL